MYDKPVSPSPRFQEAEYDDSEEDDEYVRQELKMMNLRMRMEELKRLRELEQANSLTHQAQMQERLKLYEDSELKKGKEIKAKSNEILHNNDSEIV